MEKSFPQSCLLPDEKLLWSGAPMRKFRWERRHLPLLFFSLLFLAFILIPISAALNPSPPHATTETTRPVAQASTDQVAGSIPHKESAAQKVLTFLFLALFFIGIWGAIITSIAVGDPGSSFLRGSVLYAITEHRLIVVSGNRQKIINSTDLRTLVDIRMKEWPDGLGTISFGPRFRWPYANSQTETSLSLENISEPRLVFQLIARARRA